VKRLSFLVALLLGMVVLVGCPTGTVTGPLAAPSNLRAEPGSGQIVLTWQDNSTAEEGFRIYRKLETDEAFSTEPLDTAPTDAETYTDVLVSSADSYVYQVQAFAGESVGELSQASNAAQPTLAQNEATLRITNIGSGRGVTTSTPPGINCNSSTGGDGCSSDFEIGTTVVLNANSAEDPPSVFSGFGGGCTTTALSCEVLMDASKEVTVNFAEAQPGITVQLSGDAGAGRVVDFTGPDVGGPYIDCTGPSSDCSEADYFNIGNTVVLYAEPSEGSLFTGWEGCDRVSDDTRGGRNTPNGRCDFTVDATNVITATFLTDRADPTITLTASPTVVASTGTEVTLEWTVDDNESNEPFTLALSDDDGNNYDDRIADTETGSVVIGVSSSRVFTISVTNVFGTGTATASVTEGQPPTIGTFTATPAELPTAGGDVTLTWSGVTGVASPSSTLVVRRSPGVDIDVKGDTDNTIVVPQTVTTTYTLVADNEFGDPVPSPTRTVTIAEPLPDPDIINFAAGDPVDTTFAVGGTATFTWGFAASGGTPTELTLLVGNPPTEAPPICQPATPTSPTTTCPVTSPTTVFRLRATPGGDTEGPIPITTGAAPEIGNVTVTISATADAYDLTWTPTGDGTLTYTLTRPDTPNPDDVDPITPVAGTTPGTLVYTFTPNSPAATTDSYILTAINEFGLSANVFGTDSDDIPQSEFPALPTPPVISSFEAIPPKINLDPEDNLLEWEVSGTPPVTVSIFEGTDTTIPPIFTGIGSSSNNLPFRVNPSVGTTYTLTASNAVGTPPPPETTTIEE
jgi:hypothetical protein